MTKAEEIKLLAEIDRLIKSAGDDSYIHDTFAGIVAVCYGNIVDDFGNHPVQDLEEMRKRCEGMAETIDNLNEEVTEWKNKYSDTVQHYEEIIAELNRKNGELTLSADAWEKNAHEAGDLYCELEKECAEKDMEIMRLKAEIYDLRKERED